MAYGGNAQWRQTTSWRFSRNMSAALAAWAAGSHERWRNNGGVMAMAAWLWRISVQRRQQHGMA
jgi:hypothetical protein